MMRISSIAVALLLAFGAHAEIYKWVDENGRVHYGERPPDAKSATKIDAPPASKEPPKATGRDWKAQEQEFRQRQIKREQGEAADEERKKQRERACAKARDDLEENSQRGRFYTTDDKGERHYRTDDEQAAVVAAARKRVDDFCR